MPEFTPETFRRACAKFATGIAIATVFSDRGVPHGLTINSFTSVSCDPPLVLICVDRECNLLPHFLDADHFGINVLRASQQDLSVRFALQATDRFDGIDWGIGQSGVPVLGGALAILECNLTRREEAGDHWILIGEVVRTSYDEGEPLLFFNSGYRSILR